MPSAPVQVVLEADSFRRDREIHRGGSAGKDFFEGRDADFKLHQQKLYSQVSDVSQELKRRKSSDGIGDVGYVAVTMRHSAVAKSHRPIDALLPAHITPMAGGRRLGEMIAEVNADSLEYVNEAIGKAEETVRRRVDVARQSG